MLEYRYDPPFKFTGKINKLTFKLEPELKDPAQAKAELGPMQRRSRIPLKSRAENSRERREAMKGALVFAAVGEAATGLALLIVPSLVGQLLLGEELSGVAIRSRVSPASP